MKAYISVDIGGTNIRAAVFTEAEISPITRKKIPTRGNQLPQDRMVELIAEIWPGNYSVSAIGISAPGPLDPVSGMIFSAPNIPAWKNFPLKTYIEEKFHIPVVTGNDANMAALGEWKYGAGIGHHDILYLTISTGIGGGVIIGDQLILGCKGLAGELGHFTVDPDGPACGCGKKGHLEAMASGPAISRYVIDQINKGRFSSLPNSLSITTRDIALAASQGDGLAIEALTRAGEYIGKALADYLHVFNPSIIILGGGVSFSGPVLIETIRKAVYQNVISPQYTEDLIFTTAALGDDAGLLGALTLARMEFSHG